MSNFIKLTVLLRQNKIIFSYRVEWFMSNDAVKFELVQW